MLIAGEPSGDLLAAELVRSLRHRLNELQAVPTVDAQPLRTGLPPRFFGAGGPALAAAGVELALDLTQHSVIGLWEVFKNYAKFRRIFHDLCRLAIERKPDAIIGVDYGAFNLRFASAIQRHVRARGRAFNNWRPMLVQFVSPQVWASRPERAFRMERDLDLLLSIFPFEKAWYARRVPKLRVEFVGHPIFDRYPQTERATRPAEPPSILLLPGSRQAELDRHLPVLLGALKLIQAKSPALRAEMVLPSDALLERAKALGLPAGVRLQIGGLADALHRASLALASTGTVTVECAYFGVPTVTLYRTSWGTYEIGKRLVNVKSVTMPNLLAGEEIFPEFVQHAATAENLARAALKMLNNPARNDRLRAQLRHVITSLGGPGASRRAADAIVRLLAG
jgi:lipid-A-disaccharide synthase